jgi:hypothetical protein
LAHDQAPQVLDETKNDLNLNVGVRCEFGNDAIENLEQVEQVVSMVLWIVLISKDPAMVFGYKSTHSQMNGEMKLTGGSVDRPQT